MGKSKRIRRGNARQNYPENRGNPGKKVTIPRMGPRFRVMSLRPLALIVPIGLCGLLGIAISDTPDTPPVWTKSVLTTDFVTEGVSAGDLDGDGVPDLVGGPFWFKGPDFKQAVRYRPGYARAIDTYVEDSFLSYVEDLNGNGRNDIIMVGWPGKEITIYLNPGEGGGDWPAHRVIEEAATESPIWADLDGDGKNEMVCMQGGRFGYAKVDWEDVTKPWKFFPISEKRTGTPYIHGLGVGDINGDGRPDIVEKDGWFQQPAETGGEWVWHAFPFAGPGGAQMLVMDVNGSGRNDIVSSINGHGYGLAWFENVVGEDGAVAFVRHEILPEDPEKTGPGGIQFSQLHALEAGDFDGDGRIDFVTGKRFWAHNGRDPGAKDPAVVVIFYNRADGGGVRWEPEIVDSDSGVGCQVIAVDLNGNGRLEVAAGNKKGIFVHSR